MSRSTRKSIAVPQPIRDGLIDQIKKGILTYPSENSAWVGLARNQLLLNPSNQVAEGIARMHRDDQDLIDDFALDISMRGLSLKGQLLCRKIRQAINSCCEPVFHNISVLIPQILLKLAAEWKKNPESVLGRMNACKAGAIILPSSRAECPPGVTCPLAEIIGHSPAP